MRILIAHNRIGSSAPSGENVVVDSEFDLLRRRGHAVRMFERDSDTIRAQGIWGALRGAAATPWNPFAATAIRREVEEFGADVVHVHNTFPLLSPAIFPAVGRRAVRVLTLHNYGLFCAGSLPLRDGRVCLVCLEQQTVKPALRYGCYRNSRLATMPRAIGVALHRGLGTWEKHVDAFIALTEFQKKRLVAGGLPGDRVFVKPNFFPGDPVVVPWKERGSYVVFVGRLSREKGVSTLVRAWKSWGADAPELRVIGSGPDQSRLESQAEGARIRFLGHLSLDEARRQIAHARLLVLPSECYEGFPVVLQEAFALGTPVAVSDVGPLPELVQDGRTGVVFKGYDSGSLLERVRSAWSAEGLLEGFGRQARATYLELYTEQINYTRLIEIYEAASEIAAARERGS